MMIIKNTIYFFKTLSLLSYLGYAHELFETNFYHQGENIKFLFKGYFCVFSIEQSSRCKKGWFLFNNMCYVVSDDDNIRDFKSWQDAETSCLRNGSHLVSVTSTEEKDFLTRLTRYVYFVSKS